MALRIGSVGLDFERVIVVPDWVVASCYSRTGARLLSIGPAMLARADRQAINNRLRTGTDKGNPTV